MDTAVNVLFYPEKKQNISPSSFQAWHNQRSNFIKSYFEGIKTPDNLAMKTGRQFHKMIEMGILPAEKKFNRKEERLEFVVVERSAKNTTILGYPDSHQEEASDVVEFVDYKTGKKDSWSTEKLAKDLKMKATAYLVWVANKKKPKAVKGWIEWIGTKWNGEELVPSGETALYSWEYSYEDLVAIEEMILTTINEVNDYYPEWLQSSDEFVNNDDVAEYARIQQEIDELTSLQKEVKARIQGQMEFGGVKSYKTELGSFSITERKTYTIPDDIEFTTESGNHMTRALGLEVASAMKIAEDKYKQENEPSSVSKSMSFRAKKKK